MVPGFWTAVDVKLGNTGEAATQSVRIRGAGKGVKAKVLKAGRILDGEDGPTRFTVMVKLKGFRVTTQTTCGGYGSIPTYTQNTYDFPTTSIPGNGIVSRGVKGGGGDSAYSTHLEMYVVGGPAWDHPVCETAAATAISTVQATSRPSSRGATKRTYWS